MAPFDLARFREVLGHFATGVTVVTAMEDAGPAGFTCQAFTSLSLEPPLVALAPGKSSTSWPRIREAGCFCVNILAEDQEAICRDFAVSGGDKFVSVGWRPGANGAPRLTGALAWVECDVLLIHDAGDHELVIGRVTDLGVEHGARPLLYYRGGFGRFES
jgi:flavin reductase (DIM6/NTAB) family NADH-FMN oxidoreductase RutF